MAQLLSRSLYKTKAFTKAKVFLTDATPAGILSSQHSAVSTRSLSTSTTVTTSNYQSSSSRHSHTLSVASDSNTQPAFQVKYAVSELPHPEKDHGDDANFCYPTPAYTWLGVFDGVGGWSEQGIDPAEYARALSHECLEIVRKPHVTSSYVHELATKMRQTSKVLPPNVPAPSQVLRRAYDAVERLQIIGSTTACICVVTPKWLVYSNLGDSGLKLIRNGKISFKTTEKQHAFNTPYQLGGGGADQPEDCDVGDVEVQHGDIIVLGTDGLFDNLFDDDIENIIAGKPISSASTPFRSRPRSPSPTRSASSSHPTSSPPLASISTSTSTSSPSDINVLTDINAIAQRISEEAQKRAQLPDYESPFQVAASKYHKHFRGGKLDDITVVVAQILINHDHYKLSTGSYFLSGESLINNPHTTVTASTVSTSSTLSVSSRTNQLKRLFIPHTPVLSSNKKSQRLSHLYSRGFAASPSDNDHAKRLQYLREIYKDFQKIENKSKEWYELSNSGRAWRDYFQPFDTTHYIKWQQDYGQSLQQLDHMRGNGTFYPQDFIHSLKIQSLQQSVSIEGNTITEGDSKQIYEYILHDSKLQESTMNVEDIISHTQLSNEFLADKNVKMNILDFRNNVLAQEYVLNSIINKADISEDDIKRIHSILFKDIEHPRLYPGQYRKFPCSAEKRPLTVYPYPREIPANMNLLIQYINKYLSNLDDINKLHPILFCCHVWTIMLHIHPFSDGNGRTARLFISGLLIKFGYIPVVFQHFDRVEYLDALAQAQAHGDNKDPSKFINLVVDNIMDSIAYVAFGI